MLTANLGALEFLPDEGKPFSIRDWISDEERGGFLFLTSRGDQHASLRGLISTWLEIAVNAMLSLAQDDGRRIWVILDELPTLHQVPSLQPGLAESRQFGGCFVLGVQVASALRDLYGRNGAETISGLCGTRVVLAAPDRDTAQWSADSLGRSEVEEVAEGYSYGANTIRDGVSLTPRRELRALALPSEIMRLPNLHGYLKFPGPLPVASIRLKYVSRPACVPRFVPREGGGEASPDNGDGACEGSGSQDGAGEAARPEEAAPVEPADWTGQGELDLVTEAELARERKSRRGPPAAGAPATDKPSGAAPEKNAGTDADTGAAGAEAPVPAPREPEGKVPEEEPAIEPDAAGAVPPPGPPAAENTADAPEPAAAPKDADPVGGLMRY